MIPTNLPLPHSSSSHRMTQGEKDELAEQWYAMMIKESVDGSQHDVQSTLSSLTPSTEDPQEQRHDDKKYPRYRGDAERDRLLDQNLSYRDSPDGYQIKKITPHYENHQDHGSFSFKKQQYNGSQPNNKSRTDFLDGIIKSLSELSNNSESRPSESQAQLRDKKNGWSIVDSQRRLEENYQRRRLEMGKERASKNGVATSSTSVTVDSYHQQSESEYEPRRRKNSPDIYESRPRSAPRTTQMDRGRRQIKHDTNDNISGGRRSRTPSKYESYDHPINNDNSRTNGANTRSKSLSNRSARSIPSDRSHRSARTVPTNHQKSRPWNVDKALRNANKSLVDTLSPASEYSSVEEKNKISSKQSQLPPISLPSMVENMQGLFEENPHRPDKYATSGAPPSSQNNNSNSSRKVVARDRSPSLAFSSSKDAGRILQHFMPKSCGPMNGDPLTGVTDFFDPPHRNQGRSKSNSRRSRRRSGEHSKARKRTPQKSRRSPDPFTKTNNSNNNEMIMGVNEDTNLTFPKTRTQKMHEEEILRGVSRDRKFGEVRDQRMVSQEEQYRHQKQQSAHEKNNASNESNKQKTRLEEDRLPDEFPNWESSDEYHEPRASGIDDIRGNRENFSGQANLPLHHFPTNFGSLAASVMSGQDSQKLRMGKPGVDMLQQLTRCSAPGPHSPMKISVQQQSMRDNSASPSALNMFEKIQRQLTGPAEKDPSEFPVEGRDENSQKHTEDDQRIQEKLNAVRAKSMKNAETFLKLESSEQAKIFEEDQKRGSVKKRLDKLMAGDNNSTATPGVSNVSSSKSSKTRKSNDEEMATDMTTYENEISHYMYVAYSQFGKEAQSVLKLCGQPSLPAPDRRKGEILIRINMSTISATDCAIRRGEWKKMKLDPYIIPGTALIGKVMGREKKRPRGPTSACIEPGDTVLSFAPTGGNARYICLQKQNLIKISPKLNPERVICLAETYLTAFQVLHLGQRGGMRYRDNCFQGKSVLVMDGFSPLGKAIIELSRLGGAAICYGLVGGGLGGSGPSSSSVDLSQQYKILEQWGAIPLSNDPQEWLTLIGRQIDILVTNYDPNREEGENAITSDHWKALRKDGQVHVVCSHPGMSEIEQRNLILDSGSSNKSNESKTFRMSCRLSAKEKMADRAVYYNLFDSWEGDRLSRVMARKDLEHLIKLLEVDLLHPDIAERFPLSKIAKAQRMLEKNKILGHFICLPWQRDNRRNHQKNASDKFLI